MAKQKNMPVMAKHLSLFFPEGKTAEIQVCDLAVGLVEGTMDNGESSFSLKASRAQILALLDMADSVKILTPEEKKTNALLYEDPHPLVAEEDEKKPAAATVAVPSAAGSVKFNIKVAGAAPATPTVRPPPPPGFSPPTATLATDRKRLTKPGEQGLMDDFEKSWPNKFANRKKLEPTELKERDMRDKAIDIARSYILSGDRATVKTWVEYNKATK